MTAVITTGLMCLSGLYKNRKITVLNFLKTCFIFFIINISKQLAFETKNLTGL